MDDKEIVGGNLGSVGSYDLAFKAGALQIEVKASVGPLLAGVSLALDAAKVIDALEAAIPGKIDDAVLEVIRAALLTK